MIDRDGSSIVFTRIGCIAPALIAAHMSDVRTRKHMPLLQSPWDEDAVSKFMVAKESYWRRDGLGHWAILYDGAYVGWGGFQKEGEDWDFGLVLKPEHFGLGRRVLQKAMAFAKADERISRITFLLPLSRRKPDALERLGAQFESEIDYRGVRFLKYRLKTS